MITRKIKPEENVESKKIETIAFIGSEDFTEQPKDRIEDKNYYEEVWAVFTDSGVMTSRMAVIPFTVMFDGHEVKMAGISGVASLPEYRLGGAIRDMFTVSMKQMKEDGQVFSYLYPFSHGFYRKFGYELCFERRIAKIALKDLKDRKTEGSLAFFQKGDDLTVYMDIYGQFVRNKNLAVLRTKKAFEKLMDKDPYVKKQYTYLWRNADMTPKSYITFSAAAGKTIYDFVMSITEFAWADTEGFHGMLSCLGRFDAQYKELTWEIPDTVDGYSLLAEPYNLTLESNRGGMNRIIDVKSALNLMRAPYGEGAAVISVKDDFLEWNNKTFRIEWKNGELKAEETNAAEPDIRVTVQVLVQLVCGYMTPDMAEMSGRLNVKSNRDNLNRLFCKKYLYITDRF